MAAVIFGEPIGLYELGAVADRSKLPPQFCRALYNDLKMRKFSKFAPILFPEESFGDMEKLFLCRHLALVRVLPDHLIQIIGYTYLFVIII